LGNETIRYLDIGNKMCGTNAPYAFVVQMHTVCLCGISIINK